VVWQRRELFGSQYGVLREELIASDSALAKIPEVSILVSPHLGISIGIGNGQKVSMPWSIIHTNDWSRLDRGNPPHTPKHITKFLSRHTVTGWLRSHRWLFGADDCLLQTIACLLLMDLRRELQGWAPRNAEAMYSTIILQQRRCGDAAVLSSTHTHTHIPLLYPPCVYSVHRRCIAECVVH
jgi:hypothetical protein